MKLSKKEFDGFIIGCVLGDSSLSGRANKYISFAHSEDKREYLEWKMGIVKDNLPVGFSYTKDGYINTKGYSVNTRQKIYKSYSTSHHRLTYLYNTIYDEQGRKHITNEVLEKLGVIGLAVLFMDDGCKETCMNKNKTKRILKSFKISLGDFKIEDANTLSEYLYSEYGIESKVYLEHKKYPCIKITTNENKNKFLKLVSPYINLVECMKYKINI